MNVYIEPLADELVKLWNGVTIDDVSRPVVQREFQLHAMLAWTIHDGTSKVIIKWCYRLILMLILTVHNYFIFNIH